MIRRIKQYRREYRTYARQTGRRIPLRNLARNFSQWRIRYLDGATSFDDRAPWMTCDAIRYLDGFVDSGTRVFEWGMGGSTLFFIDRGCQVVSIEHDRQWFERMADVLSKCDQWDGRLLEPALRDDRQPSDPVEPSQFGSSNPDFRQHQFREYVQAIDEFDDECFDVVVVDGRSRPSCAMHALPKLRSGGLLVLDNAERPQYRWVHQTLTDTNKWQRIDCDGPSPYLHAFSSTVIWQKP